VRFDAQIIGPRNRSLKSSARDQMLRKWHEEQRGTEMARLGTSTGNAWSVRKSSGAGNIMWLDLDGAISVVVNVGGELGGSSVYCLPPVGLMAF
jgi:hypothetical protein